MSKQLRGARGPTQVVPAVDEAGQAEKLVGVVARRRHLVRVAPEVRYGFDIGLELRPTRLPVAAGDGQLRIAQAKAGGVILDPRMELAHERECTRVGGVDPALNRARFVAEVLPVGARRKTANGHRTLLRLGPASARWGRGGPS